MDNIKAILTNLLSLAILKSLSHLFFFLLSRIMQGLTLGSQKTRLLRLPGLYRSSYKDILDFLDFHVLNSQQYSTFLKYMLLWKIQTRTLNRDHIEYSLPSDFLSMFRFCMRNFWSDTFKTMLTDAWMISSLIWF